MGFAMQVLPFDRKPILSPLPLDMNERTLPLTEQQMLQCADRQELVFGEHRTADKSSDEL